MLKGSGSQAERILERLERTRDWAARVTEPADAVGAAPGASAEKAPDEPQADAEVS